MDIIYDIETYPNCFTLAAEHADYPLQWSFEISDHRNDSAQIVEFVQWIANQGGRMVGFNNIGFDYPVLHVLLQMKVCTAQILYNKAMSIIRAQDSDRFASMIYPSDRWCEQIDLFKIHHFDNKARATSLKVIEFNMRSSTIEDLPFPVGQPLSVEQILVLKKYNTHDVTKTKEFYQVTKPMIAFRETLTKKYQRDFMNHNDTKIGKDYFIMELEKSGVSCYDYGAKGRTPKQTPRPVIALKDAILPWIQFEQPEFQRVLNEMKATVITETKGAIKGMTAVVNGFKFIFGTGGIHGSVENCCVQSNDEWTIESRDVSSYYPNMAIANRFYPQHLGEKFCDIYLSLYEQRKQYPKGSAENAMLKLALNGTFGDSNNKFSVFYDPLFMLRITINGQLLLCLLAENLLKIEGLELVMVNTDGLEFRVRKSKLDDVDRVCDWWCNVTKLQLESAKYQKMFVRDCNNYIGVYEE